MVLLGTVFVPSEVSAQEAFLERWTVSYLTEGWAPRWVEAEPAPEGDGRLAADTIPSGPTQVRAVLSADFLSLGSSLRQQTVRLDLFARVPVSDRVALIASASSGARQSRWEKRTVIETPRSEAAAMGVSLSFPEAPSVSAAVLAGWDGGAGSWGRVRVRGDGYELSANGWLTWARESLYGLPADSLRDVGVQHRSVGAELSGAREFELASIRLRPRVSWRVELLDPSDEFRSEAFLYTAFKGRTDDATLALDVESGGFGVRASYHERRVDMDSDLTRSARRAGWIAYARFSLASWRMEGWRDGVGHRWSLAVQRDRATGEISTRVETWPFLSLWETIAVQAYRLDGEVGGRAETVTLRRDSLEGGWRWGVHFGRYGLRTATESWFVTDFGFGRSDEESGEKTPNPVFMLGGDVGRSVRLSDWEVGLRLSGQVPVYQKDEGGNEPGGTPAPSKGGREIPGSVGITLSVGW